VSQIPKLLALVICLLIGVGIGLFVCQLSSNQQQNDVYLPPNVYGLPLSSLWEIVLENTKVENKSVILNWLHIDINGNGDIEHIILEFSGVIDQRCKMYHIEVNARGKVRWYSADIDNASGGMHPLTLFKELEKLNFREIPSGDDGISIDVSATSGSVGYEDNKCVDIYLLKNGSLIPLKKVIFESSIPWYPIEICKREVLRSEGSKAEVEKTVTINVNESNKESQCFVVFIPQDLSKAKIVEYKHKTTEIGFQKIVEISKEHPTVKKYLEAHPNAMYDIRRVYLTSDGLVYQVDEHWKVKDSESVGSIDKPIDNKAHYCWVVHWYDPTPGVGVDHVIDVYIDRDSYEIVFVQEAW
jgi:hypothetical protein